MRTYCAHLALHLAHTYAQFLVIVKCAEHEQCLCKLITKMCAHVKRNFVRRERGGEREEGKKEGGRERERGKRRERGKEEIVGSGPPQTYTLPYPE